MIGTTVLVVLPCPMVFQRHELIDVDLVAIDEPLFGGVESSCIGSWRWSICDGHELHPWVGWNGNTASNAEPSGERDSSGNINGAVNNLVIAVDHANAKRTVTAWQIESTKVRQNHLATIGFRANIRPRNTGLVIHTTTTFDPVDIKQHAYWHASQSGSSMLQAAGEVTRSMRISLD